jgi:uncharacterized membrane protein YedE/YeeE
MENFTPFSSTLGGILIGLAAGMMLLVNGRIAGISGIAGGLVAKTAPGERAWRVLFVLGLLVGGLISSILAPQAFNFGIERSSGALIIAGLLVGYGTRLGNGCTSGHGVCGISRLSQRSLIATVTFIVTGGLTVFLINNMFGGAL